MFIGLKAAPSKHAALNQCWFDAGPASQMVEQHRTSIGSTSCLLGLLTKRINSAKYIVSTVHRSHLITLITKAIDTTSFSYQPLWLCCWRRDISSFLFTKTRPFSINKYISNMCGKLEELGHSCSSVSAVGTTQTMLG